MSPVVQTPLHDGVCLLIGLCVISIPGEGIEGATGVMLSCHSGTKRCFREEEAREFLLSRSALGWRGI